MLPFEKALKRLEKKKNYKPKNIDFASQYIAILRRRADHLMCVKDNDFYESILYNENEQEHAQKELEVVNFLVVCLEDKIWQQHGGFTKNIK